MEKEYKIKIIFPKTLSVWEEADIYDLETAYEKLGKEETIKFQQQFIKDLIDLTDTYMNNYLFQDGESFEDGLVNYFHDNGCSIEDWITLEDYGIKVNISSK